MSILANHLFLNNQWHPVYKAVLAKAASLSYALPSINCMRLQNTLAFEFCGSRGTAPNFKSSQDWLYVLANDAPDANFARINWLNPNEVASTAGTVSAKKGWTGNADFNHNVTTGPNFAAGNCGIWFYSTIGGTVIAPETIQGQTGANAQLVTMRHRTNPRIDYILNGSTAAVQAYANAAAANNTFYAVDNDNVVNNNHYQYKNGVLQQTLAAGTGLMPSSGTLLMGITSPRVTGIVGGGASIAAIHGNGFGITNSHAALNTLMQKYMTAVQAL